MRILNDAPRAMPPLPLVVVGPDHVGEALTCWLRSFAEPDANDCWNDASGKARKFRGVFLAPAVAAAAASSPASRDELIPVVLREGLTPAHTCGNLRCINPAHVAVALRVPPWYKARMQLLGLTPTYVEEIRRMAAKQFQLGGASRLIPKMVQRTFQDGHEDVTMQDMRRILRGEYYRDYPGPLLKDEL